MFGTHHSKVLPAAGADNLRFAVSMNLEETLNSPQDFECGNSLETLTKVLGYFVNWALLSFIGRPDKLPIMLPDAAITSKPSISICYTT